MMSCALHQNYSVTAFHFKNDQSLVLVCRSTLYQPLPVWMQTENMTDFSTSTHIHILGYGPRRWCNKRFTGLLYRLILLVFVDAINNLSTTKAKFLSPKVPHFMQHRNIMHLSVHVYHRDLNSSNFDFFRFVVNQVNHRSIDFIVNFSVGALAWSLLICLS